MLLRRFLPPFSRVLTSLDELWIFAKLFRMILMSQSITD